MVSDVKINRRERYAALTCQAVLDAAKTLFVTNGFDATSVDEIARKAQASKGAVYHHFPDKQAIFTELFRSSQQAIIATVAEAMPTDNSEPWNKIRTATRLFLHSYVADHEALALLRQVVSVLGWNRVRELNEQQTLPFLRTTLDGLIANGHARAVPVNATVDIYFSMFYNAVLYITDAADPHAAADEAQAVIACALDGLQAPAV